MFPRIRRIVLGLVVAISLVVVIWALLILSNTSVGFLNINPQTMSDQAKAWVVFGGIIAFAVMIFWAAVWLLNLRRRSRAAK